jgi:inhibitor of cysteine peptidase
MKRTLTLMITIFLAAALLSGCTLIGKLSGTLPSQPPQQTADESPSATPSEAPSEAPEASPSPLADLAATVVSDTYTYQSDYIDVSIETPEVTGLSDTQAADRINAIFGDYSDMSKNSISQMESESKQLVEDGMGTGMPYELYVTGNVDYNKDGLLCVTLTNYSYYGGAHGSTFKLSLIFDLTTGDRLYLDDFMKEGSDYRSLISGMIQEEIKRRAADDVLYELVEFEDIGETPDFYLSGDALVFYFQEYAYFPYAAGIQEFPIKYSALSEALNDQYVF